VKIEGDFPGAKPEAMGTINLSLPTLYEVAPFVVTPKFAVTPSQLLLIG